MPQEDEFCGWLISRYGFLLTLQEAQKELRYECTRSVRRLIENGELVAVKVGPRGAYRVRAPDLAHLLRKVERPDDLNDLDDFIHDQIGVSDG